VIAFASINRVNPHHAPQTVDKKCPVCVSGAGF
jgi:hypothetical protein